MASVLANGINLEYEEFGPRTGTPFLLISGYTGQMTNWSPEFIEGLTDRGYRVIRFDNRDIGLSFQFDDKGIPDMRQIIDGLKDGTAPQSAPYLLDDMADDAAALLVELNATPAIVMGVSMGGMITQLVALRHPDKVRAIIPTMTTSGQPGLAPPTPEAQAALTEKPATISRQAVIDSAVKSSCIFGSKNALAPTKEELVEKAGAAFDRAYRPGGIARQYAAIVAQPRWHDALASINTPTLVLHGEVDTLIPPEGGRDVAKRIPGAKYVEVPDWGHDMPSAAVPVILSHVLGFSDEHKQH